MAPNASQLTPAIPENEVVCRASVSNGRGNHCQQRLAGVDDGRPSPPPPVEGSSFPPSSSERNVGKTPTAATNATMNGATLVRSRGGTSTTINAMKTHAANRLATLAAPETSQAHAQHN